MEIMTAIFIAIGSSIIGGAFAGRVIADKDPDMKKVAGSILVGILLMAVGFIIEHYA